MERVSTIPSPFPAQKNSGTRAKGIAYEKKVGKWVQKTFPYKVWDHQWFEYKNGTTIRYFQPDFIIERPGEQGILIEVKLTYVDTSMQLNKYLKYLSIFGISCFPLTIVKNLVPTMPAFVSDFNEIKPNSILHLWL